MKKLTVCKVWDGEYPWDVRAEKVSLALSEAGHTVHMVARNAESRALIEQLPEATVHRLAPIGWLPGNLSGASMFPAFFNPRWVRAIRRVASETGADVILCRDLPLAISSIWVGRRLGIPVVLDMAENYPAMLRSRWSTGQLGFRDYFVRNPKAAEWVENWVLERLDGVLVMVEESGARLRAMGTKPERIALVSNTPPVSRLDNGRTDGGREDVLRVVYLGLLELQRGLATLIDAANILTQSGHKVELTIIGDGVDAAILRRQAEQFGLADDVVRFRGRLPNPQALSELPSHDVGVVPHWKDESWDTTIPNKLFDYMASGLAVVTSNTTSTARIVEEAGAGAVYEDRDATDLARVLEELMDRDRRRAAGEAGRKAIREQYNWECEVERMLALLDRVTAARTS